MAPAGAGREPVPRRGESPYNADMTLNLPDFSALSDRPRKRHTSERLALAERLLLTPFDLTLPRLHKALAAMHTHQVDDADLYFQYTCSEGWSLEEGIVKTGSFSIDQGVGVRAVSGEKTAFAYSDDISREALMDAVRNVRTIGAAGQQGRQRVGRADTRKARSRALYAPLDPIGTLDSTSKVALLEKVEFDPPRKFGKKVYDDREFCASLRNQAEGGKRRAVSKNGSSSGKLSVSASAAAVIASSGISFTRCQSVCEAAAWASRRVMRVGGVFCDARFIMLFCNSIL